MARLPLRLEARECHPLGANRRRLCWAAVYDAFWAVAWFTHLRREWSEAYAAIGQPLAWTANLWIVRLSMPIPPGVAVMAHASSTAAPRQGAVPAAALLLVSGARTPPAE